MRRNPWAAATVAALFIGSVVLANWLVVTFGLVPAGFGLLVPAGTYAAGLALGLRDALHRVGNVWWVLAAIAAGAGLSFLLGDPRIAVASGVAFLLAELLDMAIYMPLRKRRWRTAVVVSNAAGAIADTVVFLAIAGFPITGQTVGGQLLVKAVWMTALFLLAAEGVRRVARPRAATA